MNAGLRAAKGKVLWFLNGGDRLDSAASLKFALEGLELNANAELGLAGATLFREGKRLHEQHAEFGFRSLLGINRVCHQALLFRRSAFDRLGPFTEKLKLASDYEFLLRVAHEGLRVALFPGSIVEYDMSGQSASDPGRIYREFAQVHQSLKAENKLAYPAAHGAVLRLEYARILAFRALGQTPMGPALRAVWHRLH
jgi:GT2 family glycosyltransferase